MAGPAGFASSEARTESSLFEVFVRQKMAGPAGFEPANAGTKTQCLTAWRRSNPPYSTTINLKSQLNYSSRGPSADGQEVYTFATSAVLSSILVAICAKSSAACLAESAPDTVAANFSSGIKSSS